MSSIRKPLAALISLFLFAWTPLSAAAQLRGSAARPGGFAPQTLNLQGLDLGPELRTFQLDFPGLDLSLYLESPDLLADPATRREIAVAFGVPALERLDALEAKRAKLTEARFRRIEREALGALRPVEDAPVLAPARMAAAKRGGKILTWLTAGMIAVGGLLTTAPPALADNARADAAQVQAAQRANASARYIRANSVQDVIAQWSPDVHVYVQGDVGLDDATLKGLERWMQKNHPHSYVVLTETAQGERFTTAMGEKKYGLDAVEWGLGHGIMNKAAFKELRDARTGKPDGQILNIIPNDRKFHYFGEQAWDDAQLGEATFIGRYDDDIKNNMRRGNLYGAVTETLDNQRRRLEASTDRYLSSIETQVHQAAAAVDRVESVSRSFRAEHPAKAAQLAQADLAGMRAELARAEAAFERGDMAEAGRVAQSVAAKADAALRPMTDFQSAFAGASGAVRAAQDDVAALGAAARGFNADHDLAGIGKPDLGAMNASLAEASRKLAAGDPAAALNLAQRVAESARLEREAMAGYEADGRTLAEAEARLRLLGAETRANAARSTLDEADNALRRARDLYDRGESGYRRQLQAAQDNLDFSRQSISAADARARNFWIGLITALSLLTLGGFLLGFFLHRRVAALKAEAEKFLTDWDAALDVKLETTLDQLRVKARKTIGTLNGSGADAFTGDTAALAAEIRANIGSLSILWTSANTIFDKAEALIKPKGFGANLYNYFFPKKYRAGLAMLKDTPVEFKPEDGIEQLVRGKSSWQKDLYGELEDYAPFTITFQDLINRFNANAKAADDALTLIDETTYQSGPAAMGAVETAIAEVTAKQERLAALGESDGWFRLPALKAQLIAAAQAALEATKEAFGADPVGTMKRAGSEALDRAASAENLADWALGLRAEQLPAIRRASGAFTAAGVAAAWIGDKVAKLSTKADDAAKGLAEGKGKEKLADVKRELTQHAASVARGEEILKDLLETVEPGLAASVTAIEAAREAIAGRVGLEADDMLREEGADPSLRVAGAREAVAGAKDFLAQGEIARASEQANLAKALLAQANAIVEAAAASLAEHDTDVRVRGEEFTRLEAGVPGAKVVLLRIKELYAASVLALSAGDPAHPSENGTIDDNLVEIAEHLAQAHEKYALSQERFRLGNVLSAASLLDQVVGHHEFVEHRTHEIHEKKTRLEATVAENWDKLGKLDATVADYDAKVAGDARTMTPTLEAYAAAKAGVEAARGLVEATPGEQDPFAAELALTAASKALEQVWVFARNDFDAHAEAVRSLRAAAKSLDAAERKADEANRDGYGDSEAIKRTYRELRALGSALRAAQAEEDVVHNDWNAVDREADRIANAAGQAAAVLSGEIQAAAAAASSISRAATMVRSASNWSGSYGVYVPGSPGSGKLSRARAYLDAGRYAEASSEAERAYREAQSAIAAAEAEVARKRREEQRRQEEERRRRRREEEARQRRARDSGGSGGSWGGGSSSGGARGGW